MGAELVLLEVVPLPSYAFYDDGAILAAFDPGKEITDSECYLAGVAQRLREQSICARTRIEVAKPELSISEVATPVQVATGRERSSVRLQTLQVMPRLV